MSDIDVCEQAASASAAAEERSTREGRIGFLLEIVSIREPIKVSASAPKARRKRIAKL
ncbi:MAG: hypothetical protein ACM30I_16135 [Gemmatimonas sp.]